MDAVRDEVPEALLVNGGGIDGATAPWLANAGEDVTGIGSLAPLIAGYLGCIVLRPDGTRYLGRCAIR